MSKCVFTIVDDEASEHDTAVSILNIKPKHVLKRANNLKLKTIETVAVRDGKVYLNTFDGGCMVIEGTVKQELGIPDLLKLGLITKDDIAVAKKLRGLGYE